MSSESLLPSVPEYATPLEALNALGNTEQEVYESIKALQITATKADQSYCHDCVIAKYLKKCGFTGVDVIIRIAVTDQTGPAFDLPESVVDFINSLGGYLGEKKYQDLVLPNTLDHVPPVTDFDTILAEHDAAQKEVKPNED